MYIHTRVHMKTVARGADQPPRALGSLIVTIFNNNNDNNNLIICVFISHLVPSEASLV